MPVHMTCFASFHTSEYELIPDHAPIFIYLALLSFKCNKTKKVRQISPPQIQLILYFNDQGNGFPCLQFISTAGGHLRSKTFISRDTEVCLPLNSSDPVRVSPELVNK